MRQPIYCQRRGRRKFYWPGRIIRIREVSQVCSDLLEHSAGSKGTGSELESIVSLNASCVPLCILLRHLLGHLHLWDWQESCSQLLFASPWCWEEIAANALGATAREKNSNWLLHRQSQKFHLHVFRALVHRATPKGDGLLCLPLKRNPQKPLQGLSNKQVCSYTPPPLLTKCLWEGPL